MGWLLWRQDLVPSWRRLDVDEAWAIDRAREGMCFGGICEGLLEWVDEQNAPCGPQASSRPGYPTG